MKKSKAVAEIETKTIRRTPVGKQPNVKKVADRLRKRLDSRKKNKSVIGFD